MHKKSVGTLLLPEREQRVTLEANWGTVRCCMQAIEGKHVRKAPRMVSDSRKPCNMPAREQQEDIATKAQTNNHEKRCAVLVRF